jgi:hypothetical protein
VKEDATVALQADELDAGEAAPFRESNDAIGVAAELRDRMAEDGYLFFRGLVARESILAARRDILDCCAEAGWLKPGTPVPDGIAAEGVAWTEPQPGFMAVYNRLQRSEAFHSLAHDPALVSMLKRLFGEPVLPHPRNIARIIFPQNTLHTTPAHQDFIHVQGTPETYTAWIPLGDCPRPLGSLVVLAGSHRAGILPVHQAYGAGGVGIDTEELALRWVGGDFQLGDAVVFHSLAVHKALANLTLDRIRLSVDYRYQPLSHPVAEGSLLPHHAQVGWPEVYEGWRSDRYQYYWERLHVRRVGRDAGAEAVRAAAAARPDPATDNPARGAL